MKIAIVVRLLWSAGTQKFAILQARALVKAGHDVEIIFLRKSKSGAVYDDLLKDLNFKIISERNRSILVPVYDWITGIFMQSRKGEGRVDYNLIRGFPKYARDKYDLIICQDQWAGLAGYYNWRKYGTPYFVIIHERVNKFPWVKGIKRVLVWLALRYQKVILLNAKKILSLTKKVADTVNEMYPKYGITCVDDFPGIEERNFIDYSEKENKIALVSFWNEVKTPEIYIGIFESINNYNFLMIGNWISESYKNSFISKLKERGVFEKVTFLSGISESEKNQEISKCKFFMRFGKGEYGPGIGTIEALEMGVPVIINTDLGISDYLVNYNCALILDDPTDPSEISKVKRFIEDNDNPDAYKYMQNEIKRFIKKHSWESHVERLLG